MEEEPILGQRTIGPLQTQRGSRIGAHRRTLDKEAVKRIGRQTHGMTVGKNLPPRCTILQKLAKAKDGAKEKEEAKEKETKEKEKDSKAAATFVSNGDALQRIVPKEKEKEKETQKEDSKEKEKDSKETAGHVVREGTLQQIAQKEREKAKEEKDCIQSQSQVKNLEPNGGPQKDTIAGTKKPVWWRQRRQLIV